MAVETWNREVARAKNKIEEHISNLISAHEGLDGEYDSQFDSVMEGIGAERGDVFRRFKRLGRLRRLDRLNLATISAFLDPRICLSYLGDEGNRDLLSGRPAELLRSINAVLDEPTEVRVGLMDEAISKSTDGFAHGHPQGSKTAGLYLACLDEEVARIFG